MFGVGRIGSYISRGVYTVSAPFHPFGGAVDVIVVEQQDGSYKSTPWYVRFGKFQGVLKATERVVSINVNGVDADFNMYLDRQGEAFFLGEFDIVDGVSDSYTSSVEEAEVKPDVWRTQKAISCNYEVNRANVVSELEGSNEKILTLSNSRQGKLFGRPFGRRSMKENACQDRESHVQINRASSLERAEIAADLLEVRWSTNLCTGKNQNISVSDDVKVDSVVSYECNIASSLPGCIQPVSSNEKADTQLPCSKIPDSSMTLKHPKACIEADIISVKSNLFQAADNCCINNDRNAPSGFSKVSQMVDNIKTEDKPGTPHCSIDEGLTGDTVITKEIVDGLPVEGSTTKESCKCLTSMVNELSSEELSAGTNHLNSLPFVSDNEYEIYANSGRSSHPSSLQGFIGDPMQEKCKRVTPSYFSNEEQFVFSDFNDPKLEKVEHIRTSSSECEECFSQGSLESGEFANTIFSDDTLQVTSKLTQDNSLINHPSLKLNLKRVSSPVLISQSYKDVDEEAIAPVAESLPDMLFDVKDLPVNMSQLYARSLDSTLEVFRMVSKDVPLNSEISGGQQHEDHSQLTTDSTEIPEVIKKIISDPAVEVSLCRHLLHEGMGYEAAACVFNAEKLEISNFFSLVPDILENDKLVVRIGGLYFPWDAAMPIASAIGSPGKKQILEPKGMIAVGQVDNFTSEGVTQNSINSQGKSWNIWPFSFKRSTSIKSKNSSMEASAEGHKEMGGNVPTVAKKKLRTKVPTSEQLASLNLKEGKNVVMFTFSTAMLGEQQVEARIFLWNWNARIVISDVDGTITKSDVLGQFMPLMGMDWSQTGVTHLFSAIKENGYQLLFLSARSISQAYHTRQFLINLKQDGKALPEGPVLISPDGLFPSLYREVIRRAPHEFKIACLEDVRVLFSADHNPFYAGFGNRDTDELSYLKMGIPKGKIFTINPKGQVVVNRRVDSKTYSSLYTLVHDMFPSTTLHEQEDYNSWNFWRLPPLIGMHNLKDHYMP